MKIPRLAVGIFLLILVFAAFFIGMKRDERFESLDSSTVSIPPLTIDAIFSEDHSWVASLPKEKTVTMIATGDVIPARSVNTRMLARNDFLWPFAKTKDLLTNADLTVINLETPLITGCPPTDEGMLFCGDPRAADGLVSAGVDIATIANNHIGNHYIEGIQETKKILTDNGITPVSEEAVIKEIKGIRFAFLAYNDIGAPEEGVPWADIETIQKDIANVRNQADVVLVSYHWGVEYTTYPSPRQIEIAHATIDAGADVVLGNHPHWIQPVELYKNKFIIYAHGNFVFDQMWSEETKYGVVGRYTFYDKKLVDVEYIPVYIKDYGQPQILTGEQAATVLSKMKEDSVTKD